MNGTCPHFIRRKRLAEEYGEPVLWSERKDGALSIRAVKPRFFAALYAETVPGLLWEPEETRFYRYEEESGLWQTLPEEELLNDIGRFMLGESRQKGFEELEARLSMRLDKEILGYLRGLVSHCDVFKRDPDAREFVIHLRNGVFPIRSGELEKFSPIFRKEYFSRNQLPIAYDHEADCPRFMEELLIPALPKETAEEDAELLFRFMGLFLLGVNLPQKILLLDGASGSGKTQLANVIVRMIGERNVAQLDTEQLDKDRFAYGGFVGKTLLYGDDVKERFLQLPGANKLKSLTGSGLIEGQLKYGGNVSMRGVFNAMITSNSELRMKLEDDSRAWRRRVAVIRFHEYEPERRIPDFGTLLVREEGAGIFRRALDGLTRLLDDLGEGRGLVMTTAQWARVDALLERSEPLAEFLRDRVEKAHGSHLTKAELPEGFRDYFRERGFRSALPTDREIGSRLKELMKRLYDAHESNSVEGGTGYRGVGWIGE